MLFSVIIRVAGSGCSLVFVWLFSLLAQDSVLGKFFIYQSYAILIGTALTFGQTQFLTRRVSNNPKEAISILKLIMILLAILLIIISSIVALFSTKTVSVILLYGALNAANLCLGAILLGLFKLNFQIFTVQIVPYTIVCILLTNVTLDALVVMNLFVWGMFVAVVLQALTIFIVSPNKSNTMSLISEGTFSFKFMLMQIFVTLNQQSIQLLAALFGISPSLIGQYVIIKRIGATFTVVLSVINAYLTPRINRFAGSGDLSSLRNSLKSVRIYLAFLAVISFVSGLFVDLILTLFSLDSISTSEAKYAYWVLLSYIVINLLTGPASVVLIAFKEELNIARVQLLVLIIFSILVFTFRESLLGIMCSFVMMSSLTQLYYWFMCLRKHKINTLVR